MGYQIKEVYNNNVRIVLLKCRQYTPPNLPKGEELSSFGGFRRSILKLAFLLLLFLISFTNAFSQKPVKVFILAGQSTMQGHGETTKGEKGNLSWLVQNDKAGKYQHLVDRNGEWKKRDDVFVYASDKFNNIHTGELTVGNGVLGNWADARVIAN